MLFLTLANFLSGNTKGLTKHAGGHKSSIDVKHIAAHDLNKKSDKHINVQVIHLIFNSNLASGSRLGPDLASRIT